MLVQSLVIVMEEGPSNHGFDQPMVYWGVYEGARGVVSNWIEDVDMFYNHHQCLKGLSYLCCVTGVHMFW